MAHALIDTGDSRSFPDAGALAQGATEEGEVVIVIGAEVKRGLARVKDQERKTAILLELGTECLGVYTGEARGSEGSNVLGFARFRLGDAEPTRLVELVKQPRTDPAALAAAKKLFEDAGLTVAVCNDFPGRIVDRLILGVGTHHGKAPLLDAAMRVGLLEEVAKPIAEHTGAKISIVTFDDLAVNAARRNHAGLIVRGLRDATDFDYEMQMGRHERRDEP